MAMAQPLPLLISSSNQEFHRHLVLQEQRHWRSLHLQGSQLRISVNPLVVSKTLHLASLVSGPCASSVPLYVI